MTVPSCGGKLPASIEEYLIRAATRGFSRIFVLWLLSHGSLSGYGIMKKIENLTKRGLNSGTMYPVLYELERGGLIVGEWARKGRRMIKYYYITEEGNKVLENVRELFGKTIGKILLEFLEKV